MSIPETLDFKPTFNIYKAGDLDKRSKVLKKFISAATLIIQDNQRKPSDHSSSEQKRYAILPPKSVSQKSKSTMLTQETRISNIKSKEIIVEGSQEQSDNIRKSGSVVEARQFETSYDVPSRSITPRPAKKKFVRYVIPKNPFSREALPKPPAQMIAPPIRQNNDSSSTNEPAETASTANKI